MWATVQQNMKVTFCPYERLARNAYAILLLPMIRSLKQALVCPRLDNLNIKFCKKRSDSTVVERTHTLTHSVMNRLLILIAVCSLNILQ